MSLHVFGIRHHGPGCARSLRAALDALSPDAILVEGPADVVPDAALVAHAGMKPPVALLVHAVEAPQNALFYPFAEFSPEWQALHFAAERGVHARFIDLPCAHKLAFETRDPNEAAEPEPEPSTGEDALREDPVGMLAEAAGFADREQWWDVHVEQRSDASGLFAAILEAMTELRAQHPELSPHEGRREAHMRSMIRDAQKQGFERIAVVCGAWHAPALCTPGPAKPDADLLKGLPKTKVAAAWIPWTYSRLAFRSGYGAGVDSPGWYAHVWRHGERPQVAWATLAARLLRGEDIDASAANVIETVRLAEAVAAVRDLPAPGLTELREAIAAVLCAGEAARLALIRNKLEIGEQLGEVPEHAQQVPLARDFERELKRLRMKLTTEQVVLDLDLRKEIDRDRSRLLHRVRVLGVEWGRAAASGKSAGTFRETWQIAWRPELAVELIAANLHGNTVESAAGNALLARGATAELSSLAQLVELAIVAHLPGAIDGLLVALDTRAASSSDVCMQMQSLEPLARLVRYSDVRETRAEHIVPVLNALFDRIFVGVLPAATQLDDDAAALMIDALGHAHQACLLLEQPQLKTEWLATLRGLLESEAVHARVRGRACRWLLDQAALAEGELSRRASLALSAAVEPAQAARFIEGLVEGAGLLLVHQEELLGVLDAWLSALSDEAFEAQLPLLRRSFSALQPGERQAIARRMKHAVSGAVARRWGAAALDFDAARAAKVLPVLAHILGVEHG